MPLRNVCTGATFKKDISLVTMQGRDGDMEPSPLTEMIFFTMLLFLCYSRN
jgi:hypothetical protein